MFLGVVTLLYFATYWQWGQTPNRTPHIDRWPSTSKNGLGYTARQHSTGIKQCWSTQIFTSAVIWYRLSPGVKIIPPHTQYKWVETRIQSTSDSRLGISGTAKMYTSNIDMLGWGMILVTDPLETQQLFFYVVLKIPLANWVCTFSIGCLLGIMVPLKGNFSSRPGVERSLWQVISGKDLTQVTISTQHSFSPVQIQIIFLNKRTQSKTVPGQV